MIYLDNSATSRYVPRCMLDTITYELTNKANAGRSAHTLSVKLGERIYMARETLKEILSASNYNVIFTKNATEALNIAILGYLTHFKRRVHVITTMLEHNSVLRPLKYLSSRGYIDVTILPINNGTISVPDIELYIRRNTRLIAISHMSNVLGCVTDINYASDISREYGIPLLVDGAQSLGHIRYDLDNSNIAMLATSGHKGLHGPQGTGFLLVKNGIDLDPIMFGGTGTDSNNLMTSHTYPESYEAGTLNAPGIIALASSAKWTYDHLDEIIDKTTTLADKLYKYLSKRDDITLYSDASSSVLSFNVGDYSSEEISEYLSTKGIAVRSGLHCAPLVHSYYGTLNRGMVRASIGYNNEMSDIDTFISYLDEIR